MMTETPQLDPRVQSHITALGIEHSVLPCDPDFADTAVFCEKYGYAPHECANTILVASRSNPVRYAACIVLATCKLDVNKKVCQLLGEKRVSFATGEQTVALTGMAIGGVTACGLPEGLPLYIDKHVMEQERAIMGGGNRSSKLQLAPQELLKLTGAEVIDGLGLLRG